MGRINEVTSATVIEILNDICGKIKSGNYDIQEIYEECQHKIAEFSLA